MNRINNQFFKEISLSGFNVQELFVLLLEVDKYG